MARMIPITLKLTPEQKGALDERCQQLGVEQSEYIRALLADDIGALWPDADIIGNRERKERGVIPWIHGEKSAEKGS